MVCERGKQDIHCQVHLSIVKLQRKNADMSSIDCAGAIFVPKCIPETATVEAVTKSKDLQCRTSE